MPEPISPSAVAARIKEARERSGLTQEAVADYLELHPRGYQEYERNRVPYRHLARIAQLLDVSETWLLRGEPDQVDVARELMVGMRSVSQGTRQILKRLSAMEERLARIEAGQLPHTERRRSRHDHPMDDSSLPRSQQQGSH